MSERMTNILGYLTLAAILVAIWILFGEDPGREQGGRGEPTFSGLADRINETAKVTLQKDGATMTLARAGDSWAVQERYGYSADSVKVRAFLRGLAVSKRREPKTSNPDRFGKLGLADDSTNVQLADDTGGVLIDIKMGTRVDNGRSLTFIFQPTDTRAWLVSALEAAPMDPGAWLDKALPTVAEPRVRAVTLNGVELARELGETEYTVVGLGDSETMAAAFRRAEPARTLASLSLEDVQKTANPLAQPVGTVEVVTHDGLKLTLTLYDINDATWAQISATYDAALADQGAAGQLPDAPADGAAEAMAFNNKTHGWLFKLSDFDADILKKKRSDFVEKLEADAPAS